MERSSLALTGNDYAGDTQVELRLGNAVTAIDRDARTVTLADGESVAYDAPRLGDRIVRLRTAGPRP